MSHRILALLAVGAWPACSFDTSVPHGGAASDASQNDGATSADADPNAPDADPNAPDATMPDAAIPPPPDASSGSVTFQQGLDGYTGTVDTYLTIDSPGTDLSALESLSWENDKQEFGLLRFDNIFGLVAQQIPTGASIMKATLTLVVFDATNSTASLREAAVDWSGATTYNDFGGDADVQSDEMHPETIASIPTSLGAHDLDVTESLTRWADGSRTNQGWVIVSNDANDNKCYSSEYTTAPAGRPRLIVDYFWP